MQFVLPKIALSDADKYDAPSLFGNEDPDGKWTVSIASQGIVTTVTGTLKVNYSYSYQSSI